MVAKKTATASTVACITSWADAVSAHLFGGVGVRGYFNSTGFERWQPQAEHLSASSKPPGRRA
jgi:hypothetical protein